MSESARRLTPGMLPASVGLPQVTTASVAAMRCLRSPAPAGGRVPAALLTALLAALVLVLGPAGPALAEGSRPTVDPAAPTPTSPSAGPPPQGTAPDGSTVGG
ncbi:MAG: dacD, partial [Modestobacter sp.]|nr:dacD [Modestobacter sp.]